MNNDPDEIRAEIERTRTNLSNSVNTLTDTVKPSHVARRQARKARSAAIGVKDRVMGTAADLGSNAASTGSSVGDAVTGAPELVKARASGSPLAAGVIALGIGWLVGSWMPASQAEQRAAGRAKETAAPMVTEAAKHAADNLKEPTQEAMDSVKSSATDAAHNLKDESTSSAQDLKDQAQGARDIVRESRS